ncbi:MAG TPA: hypothetical protein VNJ08_02235 [Bacteriovoracaceae bacterium]|nr:hypothetical protein [Bacteriovoracaceae bacterium]
MMKITRTSYSSLVLICLLAIGGCVGTVQEATPPDALKLLNPPTTFVFPGIITAKGISHNKVELEFFAASGDGIVYSLYVNGSSIPIPIDTQSLLKVAGGRMLYTVDNLTPDREYKFKITAANNKTGAISSAENEVYARTYDNRVANYKGISKVSLVPGNTDAAILVDWITPVMSGIFTSGPYDPAHYEISIISSIGGIANLNNNNYAGSDRRVILVPTPPLRASPLSNPASHIVDGLVGGTTYFVQVRAINTLYQNYFEDPSITVIPVDREMNSRYLTIKTDPGGGFMDFAEGNVVLANAQGIDAFDQIDVFWQPASGDFDKYRVVARKYTGLGDPALDDLLDQAKLIQLAAGPEAGSFVSDPAANLTSLHISGLESYATYQVKVIVCKTPSCPMDSADVNFGIVSQLKTIMVQPTLAPFNGINGIQPPGQFGATDVVKLTFDPPLVGTGYATTMEFYCVDPADHSQQEKFPGTGTPITGSLITACNNLDLDGAIPGILTNFNSQKIKGLVTNGTQEYCFAASPAIVTGSTPEVRIAAANRIVRCSYPEVFPPTLAQFPGVQGTCGISGTKGTINWNLPTGGVYSGFKVYWKEKTNLQKFSFPDAIAATPGYFSSGILLATDLTYQATGLMPGRTYQIGVLSITDLTAPQKDLYSEYNLNVKDCVVPLPIATFSGFTRIFAVGPKIDGRIPNDSSTKAPPVSAWVYEAVDNVGQPFEVAMATAILPDNTLNYAIPPGRDYGMDFTRQFDGSPNAGGLAMSKTGIVSLAWEEASMSFADADVIFQSPVNQPAHPALRAGRKFGYKVYRSSDNKLTWKDQTLTNGILYARDYTYRNRSNTANVTKRMVFFTDYSVQAMDEVHDAPTAKDIDRARIYDYKIVPIFDGKALTYATPNQNVVRVTLPPPNMALVHRWMSNRGRCLEMDKIPEIGQNYSCPYNGVGATSPNIPQNIQDTILDQAGDLLVDRYELGCRYTRGDIIDTPENGASYFERGPARRLGTDSNFWPLFKGYAGLSSASTTKFIGCGGFDSQTKGPNGIAAGEYPVGFVADYTKIIQGDCTGEHESTMYYAPCTTLEMPYAGLLTMMTPGLRGGPAPACDVDSAAFPTTIATKLLGNHGSNHVMQSEFLAVFHNSYGGSSYGLPIEGPSTLGPGNSELRTDLTTWSMNNCSINLSAIDGSGYMKPRWLGVDALHTNRLLFNGARNSLYSKTVAEMTAVDSTTSLTLYNGREDDGPGPAAFKLPGAVSRNSANRFRDTTRISRVFASNSSKLPALGKLSSEQAQGMCSNFFVQVGFASDNGNFAPEQSVKPKRSLRRIEAVAAAAWNETYDDLNIADIEASNSAGSCNNDFKGFIGTGIGKGNDLNNTQSYSIPVKSPMITGSSFYTGLSSQTHNFNTRRCISKYGIQDMIGNVTEYNNDRIFCDYTKDAIWMAPVTVMWAGGNGIKNVGNGMPQFSLWNNNYERDYVAVAKDGILADNSAVQFKLKFADLSAPRTDILPWAQIGTDSGYCSPVDGNPLKRTDPTNAFRNSGAKSADWLPIFLPTGALNTAIIEKPQADQEAVNGWRMGDGRFMDFGPQGVGAAINKTNTLALNPGANNINKYFNPVIGFPLKCLSGSCGDNSVAAPFDNMDITTTDLLPNINTDPLIDVQATIIDFPVGNSEITHPGISEFTFPASGEEVLTIAPSNNGYRQILIEKEVMSPTDMTTTNTVFKSLNDFKAGSTLRLYHVRWDVYRGTEFTLTYGGNSKDTKTGRYSAGWISAAIYGSTTNAGTSDIASGARCGLMINQD